MQIEVWGRNWSITRQEPTPTVDGGLWFRSGREKRFVPMAPEAVPTEAQLRLLTRADCTFYFRLSRPR